MTPIQCRMARAALKASVREVSKNISISHTSIALFEQGSDKVKVRVERKLKQFFADQRIFFGPAQGVCIGTNEFATERWFNSAVWQLLQEAGVHPSSRDLIEAAKRAEKPVAPDGEKC